MESAGKERNGLDVNASVVDPVEFPHLLQQYYQRLFPYSKYFAWLSYGNVNKVQLSSLPRGQRDAKDMKELERSGREKRGKRETEI